MTIPKNTTAKKKSADTKRIEELEAALVELATYGVTMHTPPAGSAIEKVWNQVNPEGR